MADLTHIHANQIYRRFTYVRATAWLAAAGTVAGFASGAWPVGVACAAAWAAAGGVLAANGRKWRSGWEGERRALQTLRRLPDDCAVLNQVRVPCARSSTGWLEADFMVVSPQGVVLVEVKNHRGFLDVSDRGDWQVGGLDGNMRPARNGARQALRQAAQMGEWLRGQGVRVWISPIVCATHPETVLSGNTGRSGVPVTKVETLTLAMDRLDHGGRGGLDAKARAQVVEALVRMDHAARHGAGPAVENPGGTKAAHIQQMGGRGVRAAERRNEQAAPMARAQAKPVTERVGVRDAAVGGPLPERPVRATGEVRRAPGVRRRP